ncbi:S1C family serine protease [Sphingomonas azotifigens]|uniref:S1C family serine protease n=1 Tax=Sphingomonas azotifigens TaxID=330920 RepID=UPI001FE2FCE7|nr:serine protease [Sphingomonas azotifigens]
MTSTGVFWRMRQIFVLVAMLLAWAAPARADDISAAGRGVVRIVTIAVAEDEVVGFGHGSGFAVAPNRIVTNAHVVELASRYPGNVVIGVVPSEGSKSFQGKLIAIDTKRDLALIEFTGAKLPPLALFGGAVTDGETLIALGYPGNVDIATARSAADFITPQSPVRSQGGFAGTRTLEGISVLLHTANIARGNSGGPLLDACGRVLGVNSAITNSEEGDATFAFAISYPELTAFLTQAKQPVVTVAAPCISVEQRMALDKAAEEKDRADAANRVAQAESAAARTREAAIDKARAANESLRETYMAGAAVLLVFGALALGAAGLLLSRDKQRPGVWTAVGGGALLLGAVALFVLRPSFDEASIAAPGTGNDTAEAKLPADAAQGPLVCTLQPDRSRITVSAGEAVRLSVGPDGCIDGGTQYAESGRRWQRVLVPADDQTVTVREFDPDSQTLTDTRYLLSAADMQKVRDVKPATPVNQCTADQAKRASLASLQQLMRAALPPTYNEKLVYHCAAGGAE